MDKEKIEKEMLDVLKKQEHKQVKQMYLTNYQCEVLDKFHIPYKNCQTTKELLFYLTDILDEEEYDELEEVAREIAEFDYYHK